jgi:MauM/NapG family ferredoxin protein
MPTEDDKPMDRRRFFRKGFAELFKPISNVSKPLERVAHELGKLDRAFQPPGKKPAPAPAPKKIPLDLWLRPPGALPEQQFRETCSRCGNCVSICPATAIKLDPTGRKGNGAPYIEPNDMACVMCEGLQCMNVCPSGAILRTSINDIDMGTAVWHSDTCLRGRSTGGKEQDCTICVDQCPLGSAAITIEFGQIAVNPLGCTGCGVCQHDCPTTPKSIDVIPIAAKTAGRGG